MRYLLSLSLLMLALTCIARQITSDEALAAAQDFFNNSTVEQSRAPRAIRVRTLNSSQSEDKAPYYIFNASDNNGFVIISGDDRVTKVLGYSDKGNFDVTNMPPQLSVMLDQFAENLSNLSGSTTDQSWTAPSRAASDNDGDVLLETANWGQSAPFNNLCPLYNDLPTSVGCVGTAVAIILKYHNWPNQSYGNINYTWYQQGGSTETISFDYGQNPYKWTIMQNEYTGSESYESQMAAAELCRDCAYAASSDFTNWATGGATIDAYINLIKHFNYDTSIRHIPYSCYNLDHYSEILKSEILEHRPVLYQSDRTPTGLGAHAFVCDGFDNKNYFHFNFGWNGGCNGYYTIVESGLLVQVNHSFVILRNLRRK